MDLNKGGRGAIERMVEAYGFSTRQALCEQLGVSKSTLATRYMRDSFPSDWVIQCALETGVSLAWLTSGLGKMFSDTDTDLLTIEKKKIIDGQLFDSNYLMLDKTNIPINFKSLIAIIDKDVTYISEKEYDSVDDGKWLIKIDENLSIRDITRTPGNRVRIKGTNSTFDASISEIDFVAKVIQVIFNIV
ncbi:phage repressor protein [Serratia fonticola]|uniref:phage repressor protein CI n=1 Tax=Serratia fonticola TaxID=47917 RepID=UPI000BFEA3C4|nr:phage repressor protein CI [Serratia fonticola]ATM78706.1 phage repressor protein [Serratia fonticola]